MYRIVLAACLAMIAAPSFSDTPLPDRRLVFSRDMDFYGADLSPLFDVSRDACEAACLADPTCQAMTYNVSARACFPKSGIDRRDAFEGALSAEVFTPAPDDARRADTRGADLAFLRPTDLDVAIKQAGDIGRLYLGGQWTVETLLDAADRLENKGNLGDARYWMGAATAQLDRSDLWLRFAGLTERLIEQMNRSSDKRRLRGEALSATVNAYLRSADGPQQVAALLDTARLLEASNRGRETIPALRLAQSIQNRPDVAQALEEAVAKYGLRLTDTQVESDRAAPRICMIMSEAIDTRADLAAFVRLDGAEPVIQSEGSQLCVAGLTHGTRYQIVLREGLPAKSGESLARDIEQVQYVRDRRPEVRFPGRAYVLPRGGDAGLPIVTVNTETVDLTVRRIDDRNLMRSLQEGLFGRDLERWQEADLETALGETIWQGVAETGNRLNADVTTRLGIDAALEGAPAGLYAVSAAIPERNGDRATQWFVLSDIGLSTFQGTDGLTVLANDLLTLAPAAGVEIDLISEANRVLAQATTDAEGQLTFDAGLLRGRGSATAALIVARQDRDLSFLSLTEAAFDLSDRGVEGRAPADALDVYLTTDRGAYRPGEAVRTTALMRDPAVDAVANVPLTTILRRPDGVEAGRLVTAGAEAGGHSARFVLPAAAPRGTWDIATYTDVDAPPLAQTKILVEDFVPERLDVDLALPEGPVRVSDVPVLSAQVDYLFGAPGADLPVSASVRVRPARDVAGFDGYIFGRHDVRVAQRTRVLDIARSDATGAVDIPLRLPELEADGVPLELEVVASATEGSGRPVERRLVRPLIGDAPVLGIKLGFDGVAPEGSEITFSALALRDAAPHSIAMTWELNRLETRYEWYELYGDWRWEPTITRSRVADGTLDGKLGPINVATNVDWGQYEIVLRSAEGVYAETSTTFWAGWYAPPDASATPDTLEVALDQPSYRPGDTADVLIDARFGGRARIAVLSDRVISMTTQEIEAGPTRLSLPVTEDWGQGAYVTVQLLSSADADAFLPGRAIGLAHAAIDPGPRALDLSLIVPDDVAPRGILAPEVVIDGLEPGKEAFVTLSAIDVGVLNLTAHEAPDPGTHYFGKRRLGVELRDLYGRLIDGHVGEMGRLRQGGDATAGLTANAPPPTEALMAWSSGITQVDSDGRARFSIDLPDFNGTVRLAAMAWTETGVGQINQEVFVRDPVVMSAALPRFLAPGDESRMQLDLTHINGPTGDLSLRIAAPGLAETISQTVVLADDGAVARISLPLRAGPVGDYAIDIALDLPGGETLTKSLTLGVRETGPATSRTQRLSLAPGETLTLDDQVFAGFKRQGAEVLLSAGPAAQFDVPRLLSDLDQYPYGCTEQITSRTLPLLYLSSVTDVLGLTTAQQTSQRIAQAVTQVLTRQASNGGFGLWRARSGAFWLDAYVTDFLSRARAAGHEVPQRAFDMALDNLSNRVNTADAYDDDLDDVVYALMVLAREGRAALSDLRYFSDVKTEGLSTPLATAQLATALALYGDTTRSDQLFARSMRQIAAVEVAGPVWRADYGTALRDQAGVYALAAATGTTAVDRSALASQLASVTGRLSTQEQAWMLLAAHEARVALGDASVDIDGTPLGTSAAARFEGGQAPRRITNQGTAPLPLTLTTIGQPEGVTEAGGRGYEITRQYFTMDGEPHAGPFQRGARYVTLLTIVPQQEVGARLMVNDALPAGLEIDNPNLLRSGDLSALPWLDVLGPGQVEHTEFRSTRFLAAVDRRGSEAFRLAYIARAVSPGTFTHPAALVEDMYRPEYRAQTASGQVAVLP